MTRAYPLLVGDAFAFAPSSSEPYPYSGLQILALVVVTFSSSLSLAVCGLRTYSRFLVKGFGMDDGLIFLAISLALPQAIFTVFVLRTGYWGVPEGDIPPDTPANLGDFWVFLNGVVYNPALALIKISALVFLLRLGSTRKSIRLACRSMVAFNLAQLCTFFPIAVIQCLPIESSWSTVPNTKCIRRDVYNVSLAAANIATDILTLSIPFSLFLGLHISKRIRSVLLGIFMLGGLVTIASIVRLCLTIRTYYLPNTDADFHSSVIYICSCVELNLAIITASAPALWPLVRRWCPSVFDSLNLSPDKQHLHPDIEVAYATSPQSCAGGGTTPKVLRGKVSWKRRCEVPSFVIVRSAASSDPSTPLGG